MNRRLEAMTLLIGELLTRPSWALHHARAIAEARGFGSGPAMATTVRSVPLADLPAESIGAGGAALEHAIAEAQDVLRPIGDVSSGAIPRAFDASAALECLVYAITRVRRPTTVLEVGVARGATTRALLLGLAANDWGHLHSIEFPPLRRHYLDAVGIFVPEDLRSRWTLHLGPSAVVLPRLVLQLGRIDLFVHDGAHTYAHQSRDVRTALRGMGPGAVIVVDDVGNSALSQIAVDTENSVAFVAQPPKVDPMGLMLVQ